MSPSLRRFADELEDAIIREIGPAGERGDPQAPRQRGLRSRLWFRGRPRVVAGTTVCVAALATSLTLVFGATVSAPAFAVTRNANGTITVRLTRLAGIAGANHRLATMGIRAEIVRAISAAAKLRTAARTGKMPPAATGNSGPSPSRSPGLASTSCRS